MNIWFNRWFSTAYNLITTLKEKNPGKYTVYVSHPDPESINLQAGDIKFEEPSLPDDEYIDYCLSICKENSITIFIPYHKAKLIKSNEDRFNNIGTLILASKENDVIENKGEFYDDIKGIDGINVPNYRIVSNSKDFLCAISELSDDSGTCFKPTRGIGAIGYKKIVKTVYSDSPEKKISSYGKYGIDEDWLYSLLQATPWTQETMVMKYLNGKEVSVDVVADESGQIIHAVPREKSSSYMQTLISDSRILDAVHILADRYKIPYVYNVQFIYKDNIPYVLEINTRIAGGCYMSEMAGVEFLNTAIEVLLGNGIESFKPSLGLSIYGSKALFIGI